MAHSPESRVSGNCGLWKNAHDAAFEKIAFATARTALRELSCCRRSEGVGRMPAPAMIADLRPHLRPRLGDYLNVVRHSHWATFPTTRQRQQGRSKRHTANWKYGDAYRHCNRFGRRNTRNL